MNPQLKYKSMSVFADIVRAIFLYVFITEIVSNVLLLGLNTDIALLWGWIAMPVAMLLTYGGLFYVGIVVIIRPLELLSKHNYTTEELETINKKFRISFLYTLLIVCLVVFLFLGIKPCPECNEFASIINLLTLDL